MNGYNSIIPNCNEALDVTDKQIQKRGILFSPNPANDFIKIEMDFMNNTEYKIYSTVGKLISSGLMHTNDHMINISNLSSGIYILQIESQTAKLIKTY